MSIGLGQYGFGGADSGVAQPVLFANTVPGNCVVLAVVVNRFLGSGGLSISSPIGTFEAITAPQYAQNGYILQWWACLVVTGPGTDVTITNGDQGGGWAATAFEMTGGVASVNAAGNAGGSSTTASISVGGLTIGAPMLVACYATDGISAQPSSPWSNVYNATDNIDVAYQVAVGSSSQSVSWTVGDAGGDGWAVQAITLSHVAPPTPTLVSPANASYQDVSSGQVFDGAYNASEGDVMNAYAFRIKPAQGGYSYWNATTLAYQSTPAWNAETVTEGESFGPSIPSTAIFEGYTYNWSLATQDATYGGQSPFAVDFTFTAQAAPVVSVWEPTGTVTFSTQPNIGWTDTLPGLAEQETYNVIVETGSYGTVPGSGTQVWTSGVTTSQVTTVMIGTPLSGSGTYRAFVQITATGGQSSAWAYSTWTMAVDIPAAPSVTAAVTTDANGVPVVKLVVTGNDNYLSVVDSSFETGVGTWVELASSCTIATATSHFLDGLQSLKMAAAGTGGMSAATGFYSAIAGDHYFFSAAVEAASTTRTCELIVNWYNGATLLSSTTIASATDSSSAWTTLSGTHTAPTSTTQLTIEIATTASAASENHFVDCVGFFNSTATAWALGGFVGNTAAVITRSDNLYVRFASLANPLPLPSATQVATVYDYEAVPSIGYTYSATTNNTTLPLTSPPTVTAEVTMGTTNGWWELNPAAGTATTNPSAVNAQLIGWTPIQTEQSTANQVIGQSTMSIVANAMMAQDFAGTAETFKDTIYTAFNALLTSQAILFISSPWGPLDSGYFRVGPQSGGMSSGQGNTAKNTTLMPSVQGSGHRTVAVTAVAQPRPPV